MQALPQDELRLTRSLTSSDGPGMDQQTALRLKKRMAEEFRNQLIIGAPSNADEESLRRLSAQLKARKVVVKLHLRHTLHAKLYLLYRPDDYNNPITGFLGSSNLTLPRYGLGNYISSPLSPRPTDSEKKQLENLGRAGKRLMGFSCTNLFKRLESGDPTFIQSIERHILRNFIFIHALEKGFDLPLGTQEAELLDARTYDEDAEAALPGLFDEDEEPSDNPPPAEPSFDNEATFREIAGRVYAEYAGRYKRRFKWLRSNLFRSSLKSDLLSDAQALLRIRAFCGAWQAHRDTKLAELIALLTRRHPTEKILVFSQFADTIRYLETQLIARGLQPTSNFYVRWR